MYSLNLHRINNDKFQEINGQHYIDCDHQGESRIRQKRKQYITEMEKAKC